MKKLLSLALVSAVLVSAQAFAEPHQRSFQVRDPGVNRHQHMQEHRIKQGVRSGQLTGEETRGLMQDRRGIRQQEREYKSDGMLTRDERKDLHQDLNQLSKEIYSEKHDGDVRPTAQ